MGCAMNTSLSKILQRVAVVSTALLLASCFHNDGDSKVAAIQSLPVGQLHAVSSKDELEYFLKLQWPACGLGFPISLEEDVSWLHVDTRPHDGLIKTFKP